MAEVVGYEAVVKGDTIEHLRELLAGRRVLSVERRVYPSADPEDHNSYPLKADYPVLYLDDGSEVILLDGWGNPPISEQEKLPNSEPTLWEGDGA